MFLEINNVKLSPDQDESSFSQNIKEIPDNIDFKFIKILKKSLDARNKNSIHYVYKLLVNINDNDAIELLKSKNFEEQKAPKIKDKIPYSSDERVIIIGTGPAGLFCALKLIESGAKVLLLERGKQIEERMKDINNLEKTGDLNPESNVLYGEGGAGTYSDGKLTSRSNKIEINWFYEQFLKFGAKASIAYESKPHIGTDKLQKILTNMRNHILESGSEIIFKEKVTDFIIKDGEIRCVRTEKGNEYRSSKIVLAMGHSSRDTYENLNKSGVFLEKKGFAMGVRIEHPAEEINKIQYGKSKFSKILPPAEYQLINTDKKTGKAAYSFCMCPGGAIINSSSEEGLLCTNGMSNSKRNMKFSNSALVVTVSPEDLPEDPLAGMKLQREIEKKAFDLGGGQFRAPAQRLNSFLYNKKNIMPEETSYRNGIAPAELKDYLPKFILTELKKSMDIFNNKMRGFISENAILIGAETRTSSPLRITRNIDFQSVNTIGLYPIGEGAGYSGGIVSSAIDGIRCADSISSNSKL